jgi:hypothetical protein
VAASRRHGRRGVTASCKRAQPAAVAPCRRRSSDGGR